MRLWSLHPRYLDAGGLVAAWREALLAQKVLQGKTRGYRRHPQLERFRQHPTPTAAIAAYLQGLYAEATRRGYQFDRSKIASRAQVKPIAVTQGQLGYEWQHLKRKLRQRDPARYRALLRAGFPEPHPLFRVVAGEVEAWEKVRDNGQVERLAIRG
jgi:hypothetical protein